MSPITSTAAPSRARSASKSEKHPEGDPRAVWREAHGEDQGPAERRQRQRWGGAVGHASIVAAPGLTVEMIARHHNSGRGAECSLQARPPSRR